MQKNEAFRLLIGSGFALRAVEPKPNYHLFKVERTELLGTRVKYHIAIASSAFAKADVDSLLKGATMGQAALVLVGDCDVDTGEIPLLTPEQLADRLGGPILSLLPFEEDYGNRLVQLGRNSLPIGLSGDTSDLFEKYVHAGLQFIFYSRVIRYGQDRRFEKVADGVALGDSPLILYDAKAYGSGYEVGADSIRQFADYVNSFHRRYRTTLGQLTSFLVISGTFSQGQQALDAKSGDMRASAGGVGLCFITAEVLAYMVAALVHHPSRRSAIDWNRLLVRPVLTIPAFNAEVGVTERDGAIPQ